MTDTTTAASEPARPLGLPLNNQLGLVELAKMCARHCREGMWGPSMVQNEQGVRTNAAMLLDQTAAEIEQLRQVWEDTRTQRDQLMAHIKDGAPLPEWAAKWIAAL